MIFLCKTLFEVSDGDLIALSIDSPKVKLPPISMGSFIHIAEAFVMFVFYETPFESGE